MSSPKLTDHLVSLNTSPSYAAATQHSFLTAAGNGTLSRDRLALWLSQDRIYAAHAYPRFIGAIISRIPFSNSDALGGKEEQDKQEILQLLVGCLTNVVREVAFFKETADTYGLDMEKWAERKGTRDYTAEMARISSIGTLDESLVFLWAMERVYFDAWSYVKKLQASSSSTTHADGGVTLTSAVQKFATNWSSSEFEAFVNALGALVDKLDIQPGTEAWMKSEHVWNRVVELEVGFWPEEGEEVSM